MHVVLAIGVLFLSSRNVLSSFATTNYFGANLTPLEMEADRVFYASNGDLVAAGAVKITFKDYKITADEILYKKPNGHIFAKGNVIIHELKSGNVHYTNEVLINHKNDNAMLMPLKSRILGGKVLATASYLKSLDDKHFILGNMTFSPCKICYKRGSNTYPFWQLRAKRVIIDLENDNAQYKNMHIDFVGLPIFYMPHFVTPSLKMNRKSGFLLPKVGYSSRGGVSFGMPYYWTIQPNMDTTITPHIVSKGGMFFTQELRHRLYGKSGYYLLYNVTKDDNNHGSNSENSNSNSNENNTKNSPKYRGYL
ncbi:MAG: LPS-assembly protein LptD, partial [Proteobacteria bacterium]|nr:LPS-assembly protein LptD [Pseudomonadota bacterium]